MAKPAQIDPLTAYAQAHPGSRIADVIGGSQVVWDKFQAADRTAIRLATRHRRVVKALLIFSLIGALASAAALAGQTNVGRAIADGAAAVQLAALLIVGLLGMTLRLSGLSRRWAEARATAEDLRCDYFRQIIYAPTPDPEVQLAKLDVFETSLLRDQITWFDRQANRHARRLSLFTFPRLIAYLLVIIAFWLAIPYLVTMLGRIGIDIPLFRTAATFFEFADGDRWRLAAVAAAQAFLAFAGAAPALEQDERKANLYRVSAKALRECEAMNRLAARDAASRGDDDPSRQYVEEVCRILEFDHFAWKALVPRPAPVTRLRIEPPG